MKAPVWLPPVVAGGLVAALVCLWNYDHRALVDARRSAEAEALRLKGQVVAEQESRGQLKRSFDDLVKQDGDFRQAVAAAKAAAPSATPSGLAHLSTGSIKVHAVPGTPLPEAGSKDFAQPVSNSIPGPVEHSGEGPTPCVLADGDEARIQVDAATLDTKEGNTLVVGAASVWRGAVRLFGGGFQAPVSALETLEKPALPRWGAGVYVACSVTSSCALGPALAFPPLRMFGLQLEATAGAALGPGGLQGGGTAIIRW